MIERTESLVKEREIYILFYYIWLMVRVKNGIWVAKDFCSFSRSSHQNRARQIDGQLPPRGRKMDRPYLVVQYAVCVVWRGPVLQGRGRGSRQVRGRIEAASRRGGLNLVVSSGRDVVRGVRDVGEHHVVVIVDDVVHSRVVVGADDSGLCRGRPGGGTLASGYSALENHFALEISLFQGWGTFLRNLRTQGTCNWCAVAKAVVQARVAPT